MSRLISNRVKISSSTDIYKEQIRRHKRKLERHTAMYGMGPTRIGYLIDEQHQLQQAQLIKELIDYSKEEEKKMAKAFKCAACGELYEHCPTTKSWAAPDPVDPMRKETKYLRLRLVAEVVGAGETDQDICPTCLREHLIDFIEDLK